MYIARAVPDHRMAIVLREMASSVHTRRQVVVVWVQVGGGRSELGTVPTRCDWAGRRHARSARQLHSRSSPSPIMVATLERMVLSSP